ncbi:hypothetical protein [Massilia aerilata]|uniref:Uncharacterized protein n=1 Tax=Massilia aerilata TaxID=453817 RepID=A0ABW0S200_9BURK
MIQRRRYPFLLLSIVAHAALLGVLYRVEPDQQRIQRSREQSLVDAGQRLTERARLEKRVRDMARIKSQLESGTADKDDEVQFSAQPRTPEELLKEARELSRKIDEIERNDRAERLAKLLRIPKQKALEKLAQTTKPEEPAGAEAAKPVDAAVKIEQLEAKARDALARRGLQREQQQDGTRVAAGELRSGSAARQGGPGAQVGGAPAGAKSPGGLSMSSVFRTIDAFMHSDRAGRGIEGNIVAGNHDDVDSTIVRIPEVPAGARVKGTGRIVGPGGPYADRVYVNRWYLIGPFERKHGDAWLAPDPPEQAVVLDAAYRGKDGRLLKWEYVDSANYPLVPPQAAEEAVYYGYTELMVDKERDLTIWVGAHDDAQLWLNDVLVWRGRHVAKGPFYSEVKAADNPHGRDYNFSEGKRVVHLRQGRNKLFFKLSNGLGALFFSLVLTK